MAIRNANDRFNRTFTDGMALVLEDSRNRIANVVGSVKKSIGNIFNGGFAGMSEAGMSELASEINKYCKRIEAKIAEFNEHGDIEVALKGDVQVAALDFVAAIKELLRAYVSTMRQEITEAKEAYQNFLAAGRQISQDIQSDAGEIRSNASDIRLD